MTERVYMKGTSGNFYLCKPTTKAFKCGKCLRGHIEPEKGYLCKVCGSRVAQVIQDSDFCLGDPLE